MSGTQRLAIVVGAVIAVVAAFILFKPDDEQPTTRETGSSSEQDPRAAEADQARPAPAPRPRVERLEVRGGEPVGGVENRGVEIARLEVRP